MKYIYVLQHVPSGDLYIGKTNNISRRLKEHNSGGNISTKRINGLWKLVYAEVYRSEKDADIRELRLKKHGRAKQELYKRISFSLLN